MKCWSYQVFGNSQLAKWWFSCSTILDFPQKRLTDLRTRILSVVSMVHWHIHYLSKIILISVPESDELRWVLDITIAYPEGKPLDLPTIVFGSRPSCQTFILYRLYPSSQVFLKFVFEYAIYINVNSYLFFLSFTPFN